MTHLEKHLERLEARLMDGSGWCLTAQVVHILDRQAERLRAGEKVPKPPIAFFDAVLARWRERTKLRENAPPAQEGA